MKIMKNPNKLLSHKNTIATLAATSALAIAASGLAAGEAGAKPSKATPKAVLTGLVDNLIKGTGYVEVPTHDIKIPGPVGTAKGEPIVFKTQGHTYLAYTQGEHPNFNQKEPADLVGDMAIVREPSAEIDMHLQEAFLDKANILVNAFEQPVGYSIGGDTTGK
jgi:hypothetical protein